ncbi:hypothetical protein LTR84_012721 [Exophiala bonariae]|uniref:Uncharacterized protein n=1 Tax=Exophiala bonariae TaxID=1690606 RepID=A0AAV9NG15_9EURO|nr:hypothetical protein LTR84_012721 [Exophiala bonariae]
MRKCFVTGTNNGLDSVTTMTALLALHIESAINMAETDLVRSMARISISHVMLLLTQRKDLPVLKRALPIFDKILTEKNLYLIPPNNSIQGPTQPRSQENNMAETYASPTAQFSAFPSLMEPGSHHQSFDGDFLGFDFLDDWQIGQLDFADQ